MALSRPGSPAGRTPASEAVEFRVSGVYRRRRMGYAKGERTFRGYRMQGVIEQEAGRSAETTTAGRDAIAAAPGRKAEPAGRRASHGLRLLVRARRHLRDAAATARSALGPFLGAAGQATRSTALRAGTRLRLLLTDRIAPALAGAGRWLLRRLKPQTLAGDYRRLLAVIHSIFLDRGAEALFFVPTRGRVSLVRLNIPARVRESGHDYRPTPRLVFEWAMSALPAALERRAFVDFGAGRGRVLLLASHYPFEIIRGAEIARELHEDCAMNIAQYSRSLMRCRDVECLHARATTLPIPHQPTVFYFFDPFDLSVLDKVLARIVRSYKRQRREMHLICVGMDEAETVERQGIFYPVPLPRKQRLLVAAFSPYSIRVYKTDPEPEEAAQPA